MDLELAQLRASFQASRELTRHHAKSFYFSSHTLPPAKREGAYAPWWHELAITVHGGGRYRATLGGKALATGAANGPASGAANGPGNSFILADQPQGAEIELTTP